MVRFQNRHEPHIFFLPRKSIKMNKKLSLLLGLLIVNNAIYAQSFFSKNETIIVQLITIAVTSIFTFLITFYFTQRRERKKLKEISYDMNLKESLLDVSQEVEKDIVFTYKGNRVENIAKLQFDIENTGGLVVKGQQVRLKFNSGLKVLDIDFDPLPLKEIGVWNTPINEIEDEIIFKFDHLEKGQHISANIIIQGDKISYEIFPFNPEGDVKFSSRKSKVYSSDKEILRSFFGNNFTLILLYLGINKILPIITGIPGFSTFISILIYSGILIINVPYISNIANILSQLITRNYSSSDDLIKMEGENNTYVQATHVVIKSSKD